MKTLYVIGNGFDRAHGLPTAYWDFRSFLDKYHPDFLYQFENLYNIRSIDESDPRISKEAIEKYYTSINNVLWKEFEYKMGLPDISEMMNFSQCILQDMDLDGGNYGIKDTMDDYWNRQYGFVTQFQEYVLEWAEKIDTTHVSPKRKALVNSNDLFLSFNYTDVLENVYTIKNVLHVHGGIRSISETPPIMGHSNSSEIQQQINLTTESEEVFDEGSASIHNAIANYLKSIYKDTSSIIPLYNSFWKNLAQVNKVEIIGWSIGDADLPYLKCITQNISPQAKWVVYYYLPENKNELICTMKNNGIDNGTNVFYKESCRFWD